MIKFTKKEISLCRQVAKKHRKKIEQGGWYFDNPIAEPLLWSAHNKVDLMPDSQKKLNVFPLWTISDCLEFFEKRDYQVEIKRVADSWFIEIWELGHKGKSIKEWTAKLLEACLKAVLAVLKEEK